MRGIGKKIIYYNIIIQANHIMTKLRILFINTSNGITLLLTVNASMDNTAILYNI